MPCKVGVAVAVVAGLWITVATVTALSSALTCITPWDWHARFDIQPLLYARLYGPALRRPALQDITVSFLALDLPLLAHGLSDSPKPRRVRGTTHGKYNKKALTWWLAAPSPPPWGNCHEALQRTLAFAGRLEERGATRNSASESCQ